MLLKKNNLLVVLFFLSLVSLYPQSWAESEVSLELQGIGQFSKSKSQTVKQSSGQLRLSSETKYKYSESFRIKLEPSVLLPSDQGQFEQQPIWNFRESWIEYRNNSDLKLQIGSLVKVWEGTDGINPMDITTQKNLTDPLHTENLGSPGIWIQKNWNHVSVEVIGISPTKSVLPGENSGWWPREYELPIGNSQQQLLLPETTEYQILSRQDQNQANEINYGARVKFNFSNFDFSIAGFDGVTQSPLLRPIISGTSIVTGEKEVIQMTNPIQIQPIDDRRRTFAVGANLQINDFIFRIAGRTDAAAPGNLKHSVNVENSKSAVFAIEKSFSVFKKPVISIWQYSIYQNENASTAVVSTQDIFNNSLILGFKAQTSDAGQFQLSLVDNLSKSALIAQAEYHYRFTDHTNSFLGCDYLQGPQNSLIGLWQKESKLRLGLRMDISL